MGAPTLQNENCGKNTCGLHAVFNDEFFFPLMSVGKKTQKHSNKKAAFRKKTKRKRMWLIYAIPQLDVSA